MSLIVRGGTQRRWFHSAVVAIDNVQHGQGRVDSGEGSFVSQRPGPVGLADATHRLAVPATPELHPAVTPTLQRLQ
jgi:hypothetical protein